MPGASHWTSGVQPASLHTYRRYLKVGPLVRCGRGRPRSNPSSRLRFVFSLAGEAAEHVDQCAVMQQHHALTGLQP